jgi:hypothetical protein
MSYNNKQKKGPNLADYAEVKDRIISFYKKFPEGRILTEIVKWEDNIIVMKAWTFRNPEEQEKGLIASVGHAYEDENASYINKTSALENCETSAVGRALANLGFDIRKSVASRLEVENALERQRALREAEASKGQDGKDDLSLIKEKTLKYGAQRGFKPTEVMSLVLHFAQGEAPTEESYRDACKMMKEDPDDARKLVAAS